jgi:hypothetical protein
MLTATSGIDRDPRDAEGLPMVGDENWLDAELRCATCGRALNGHSDEDPTGDVGQPICGQCVRDREGDFDLFLMDAADGELDGVIDG